MKQTPASAFSQTAGLSLPACVYWCPCPAMPQSWHDWVWKGGHFIFLCYEQDVPLDGLQCIWKYWVHQPSCFEANWASTPLRLAVVLAGTKWFSPLSWGAPRNSILCQGALRFRTGGGFLPVLTTNALLSTFVWTRGFFGFDNRPLCPPSQCSETDRYSCVWWQNCFSQFFFLSPGTPLWSNLCSHHEKSTIFQCVCPCPLQPPRQIFAIRALYRFGS